MVRIDDSHKAAALLKKHLCGLDHEELWVLFLDGMNEARHVECLGVGTMTECLVDIRRIVKYALAYNSRSIILGHNHPSGNPQPGSEDIAQTEKVRNACKLFDIPVLDHIILGRNSYYSFADECEHKGKERLYV